MGRGAACCMRYAESLPGARYSSPSLLCDTGQEGMSKVLDQILGVCFPQGKPRMESLLEHDRKDSLLDKVLADRAILHCPLLTLLSCPFPSVTHAACLNTNQVTAGVKGTAGGGGGAAVPLGVKETAR